MTDNCIKLAPNIDWGMLILEVQTAPDMDAAREEFTGLYQAIFGFLVVNARKWLISRKFSDAHDLELASLGLDKVLKEIIKFEIPDASSEQILRSFKAWAMTCSRREWTKRIEYELNLAQDTIDETKQEQTSSVEDILIEEENKKLSIDRTDVEVNLRREILEEALNELPSSMRDALLEIEELKRLDKPHARGKQGESKLIAEKYGYTQGSIRTAKSRLSKKVKDRFNKGAQEMKAIKDVESLTEHELSTLLIEIAIERGLSIPQTADEVKIFEEKFSNEISQANKKIPDLNEVLALSEKLKKSETPILVTEKTSSVDETFQMAARNGKSISEETHNKMDEAVKRAKEKSTNDRK